MSSLKHLIDLFSRVDNIHISVCDISGVTSSKIFSLPNENLIHSMKFCDYAKATASGFALCMRCKGVCNKAAAKRKKAFAGDCAFGQYEIVYPVCAGGNVICIIYIGNLVKKKEAALKKLRKVTSETGGNFEKMSEQLGSMHKAEEDGKYFEIAEFISEYILYHYSEAQKKVGNMHWAVKTAAEYVNRDYSLPLTLHGIAKACFINEKYLGRIFKKEMGKSFHEYLTETRLSAAEYMLSYTDESVIKIALDCGFGSSAYFSGIFKRCYGITPNQFKKGMLKNPGTQEKE